MIKKQPAFYVHCKTHPVSGFLILSFDCVNVQSDVVDAELT